ncbi:MAG: YigZ family protein [Clostridiales bacterium]|jgi:uncharacterized YigZ family protein|nr:YigZ family protein [Clostridiales bacterium]
MEKAARLTNKRKTVYKRIQAEITEKKSRFIATVAPVASEDEAREFLRAMKKTYWDARHNVFAYRIGFENETRRFSDDGEPSGSAGGPVLDVITGENLTDIAINVTRYFGGVLLGVGGLVRAYGAAAKKALTTAEIVEKIKYDASIVTVSYPLAAKVRREAEKNGYVIKNAEYADDVRFEFLSPAGDGHFASFMADLTGGGAVIEPTGGAFGFWRGGELIITD